ncbi:MAG: histidinol-phosphate transaminase [Candidatus Rokuibacteriota bacterium]
MPPRWRASLADIVPYVPPPPLAALEAEVGHPILRLSANENPLGPSPLAVAAIRAEAYRIHLYPDGGAPALCEAVAAVLGVSPDQLLFGNGGDEIITLVARALLEPGDEVVIPDPSFEPYASTALLAGATVIRSPLRDYGIDLDDMLGRVTPRTKLVCLSSPHNPTGVALPRAAWEQFAAGCPHEVLILLDEAYVDFVEDAAAVANGLSTLRTRPDGLVLLRTFSKIAGLAGLRVGYAVAAPAVIAALERTREPFNVGRLAQVGAVAAVRDTHHREATRRVVWGAKPTLYAALRARGLAFAPSDANFLIARIGRDSGPVVAAMRARGVLVRDGAAVGLPGHLRITIGTTLQNERMLAALDAALGGGPRAGAPSSGPT